MLSPGRRLVWLYLAVTQLSFRAAATDGGPAEPLEMKWSHNSYGYDGPWNAVTIGVGGLWEGFRKGYGPDSIEDVVDVFPATRGITLLTTPKVCERQPGILPCAKTDLGAGFYHPNETVYKTRKVYTFWKGMEPLPWYSVGRDWQTTIDLSILNGRYTIQEVDNVLVGAQHKAYYKYPNGMKMPLAIGFLDLGSPLNKTQRIQINHWNNSTSIPNDLALQTRQPIPSSSFGLHIGSAALGINGSLYYGGYDPTRVLGPVLSQSLDYPIPQKSFAANLVDLRLVIARGPTFPKITEGISLLRSPAAVDIEPHAPYIYLPPDVCNFMAWQLPIHHDPGLNLYLWDETSPEYKKLAKSKSYIAFTFKLDTPSSPSVPIKVPIQLLNLTLQPPLVEKPTQYFPCNPIVNNKLTLGRAFLQAAFFGANWRPGTNKGSWFLAQAPGPNIFPYTAPKPINEEDTTIAGAPGFTWEDSWSTFYREFEPSVVKTPPPVKVDSGLSTGVKAGIGIGAGALVILMAAVLAFYIRGRRPLPAAPEEEKNTKQPKKYAELGSDSSQHSSTPSASTQRTPPTEMEGSNSQVTPLSRVEPLPRIEPAELVSPLGGASPSGAASPFGLVSPIAAEFGRSRALSGWPGIFQEIDAGRLPGSTFNPVEADHKGARSELPGSDAVSEMPG